MSDVSTFYGGSILAMAGDGCISIVSDKRLGNGPITVSKSFNRVFQITPRSFIGLSMFIPDCQYLLKKVQKYVELFRLDEGRIIEPKELAHLVSAILYSHRTSPLMLGAVVVGLDSQNKPYVCNMDCIGCICEPGNFVTEGTAANNLVGMCEILYKDNLQEKDLFVVSAQAFLNSIDRDALSGWNAECITVTPSEMKVYTLKARCD